MRGRVKVASNDPKRDAARYAAALSCRLHALRVGQIEARDLGITVHLDKSRLDFTWSHPFKGVSSARFLVVTCDREIHVEYDLGISKLVATFALFGIIVFIFSLSFPRSLWNLGGPPTAVALVAFLNVVIITVRVRAILKQVGQSVKTFSGDTGSVLTTG